MKQKKTAKPKKQKKQERILLVLGFLVVVMILIVVLRGILGKKQDPAVTSEGLKIIQKEEKADIKEIEAEIERLENGGTKRADSEEAGDGSSSDENGSAGSGANSDGNDLTQEELFAKSVVIGDSITEGLSVYGVLDDSSVSAKVGASLSNSDDLLAAAAAMQPEYVFLAFGSNDLQMTGGNSEKYQENYEAFLQKVQAQFPNAKIFVNGIFPVTEQAAASDSNYEQIDAFNKVLKKICKQEKLTYIDTSDLPEQDDYASDGVHMNPALYKKWAERMTEVAAS